jgi:Na+/H+ antiporter NhaD/arsenite permease-like protein
MILPFGVLLATIALAPVLRPQWWLKHYPKVALSLGAVTLAYYVFGLQAWPRILNVGHEYVSFIALIGSLFVVSGGIHIGVKGRSTPAQNVLFLFIGAVIANVLGTTGASMLLIRPWLRMNQERVKAYHIVFFIFIVSNIGGCLTPIGDPPLFLGYLKGIPFWWVGEHCWPMWSVGVGYLLAVFYALDVRDFRRSPAPTTSAPEAGGGEWRFEGRWNLAFLALIIVAVFINQPLFLREGLMLAAAAGSWFATKKSVHEANQFNFHPIQEVAILFIGIFATMMPALDWLQNNAATMGRPTPALFYWASGGLSSVLDNAPTYLSFLSAIFGSFVPAGLTDQVMAAMQQPIHDLAAATAVDSETLRNTINALKQIHGENISAGSLTKEDVEVAFILGSPANNLYVMAISIGAVFFGAATYIGNGPNFMVKAIGEHQKVPTPGFISYVLRYTIPCLLPLLILLWFLFFRAH